MPQTRQVVTAAGFVPGAKPLPEQIADAVQDRTTPLSMLLRLMAALDAQGGGDETLRLQLRARIGAPLDA